MTLHIFGHPRSGNHYLRAVLEANDLGPLNQKKYGPTRSPHSWPPDLFDDILGGENRFLYVWRTYAEIAPSMLAKEQAQGRIVDALSVPYFTNTPWRELIEKGQVRAQFLNRWVPEERWHMTPYDCWKNHICTWLSLAESRTDVYAVPYSELISRFDTTMSGIARWLGSARAEFVNVTKKVDPAPVREGGYNG